jgi:hypothetical protein
MEKHSPKSKTAPSRPVPVPPVKYNDAEQRVPKTHSITAAVLSLIFLTKTPENKQEEASAQPKITPFISLGPGIVEEQKVTIHELK